MVNFVVAQHELLEQPVERAFVYVRARTNPPLESSMSMPSAMSWQMLRRKRYDRLLRVKSILAQSTIAGGSVPLPRSRAWFS